ncbi:MAG: hypothetical protein RKU31_17035 [Deltaproteobacteria bacterium]|jgi:hypothetical protein
MNTRTVTALFSAASLVALAAGATACKEAAAKTQGVGDNLRAFVIKNCEDGKRYCQVCAYGGRPTLMTIADLDDDGVEKDLQEMEKLLAANKDKGLTAFALFGHMKTGKFVAVSDDDAATKKLAEMKKRLGLSFPLTIVPSQLTEKEQKSYMPFDAQYAVGKSRTLFAAASDNEVFYADVMTGDAKQYEKLAAKLKEKL